MQRSNLILAGLAAAVVVAAVIGMAGSARWTGEHRVSFTTTESDLVAQGPLDAGGAGAVFEWLVPANATEAELQVAVVFSGQAVQGGSSTVSVRVTAPDGRTMPDTVAAMAIPPGATSAALVLSVPAHWLDVPEPVRDTGGAQPAGTHWMQPLRVLVVASQPSDLPVASYGFEASIVGTITTYMAA